MKKVKPVLYVPVQYRDKIEKDCLASAGPRPVISGMRRIWGNEAYIIKSGVYIYKVSESVYNYYLYK